MGKNEDMLRLLVGITDAREELGHWPAFSDLEEKLKGLESLAKGIVSEVVKEQKWVPLVIKEVKRGDIIRHVTGGDSLVVEVNHGNSLTAVRTAKVCNESEWEVLSWE